eukprot:TRINITY_DN1370_c0_g1_i4.p1 TRINITY_DN1370_c0_g1~~TRINITY_DN1370_c0_g1_i4.p1  ORF type:complete len:264 (-),score=15.86 TRINITY_DN1370_c0_g1_i4:14-805(-)
MLDLFSVNDFEFSKSDEFTEEFFDSGDFELHNKGHWLHRRTCSGKVEWRLKEQVKKVESYLDYVCHRGEDQCKDFLKTLFPEEEVEEIEDCCNFQHLEFRTCRYSETGCDSYWIDVATFTPKYVYITLTIDCLKFQTIEEHKRQFLVNVLCNSTPAPSKAMALLYICQIPGLPYKLSRPPEFFAHNPFEKSNTEVEKHEKKNRKKKITPEEREQLQADIKPEDTSIVIIRRLIEKSKRGEDLEEECNQLNEIIQSENKPPVLN